MHTEMLEDLVVQLDRDLEAAKLMIHAKTLECESLAESLRGEVGAHILKDRSITKLNELYKGTVSEFIEFKRQASRKLTWWARFRIFLTGRLDGTVW